MSDTKGCLGIVGGTIGWFVVWGLCISVGENYKISPFLVLLILIIITIAIGALIVYVKISAENKNIKRANEIEKNYPRAYNKYAGKFPSYADAEEKAKEIANRPDSIWEREEKEIERQEIRRREIARKNSEIATTYPNGLKHWKELNPRKTREDVIVCEDEIKRYEVLYQECQNGNNWEREQTLFTNQSYNLSSKLMSNFGRYVYTIPFEKTNADGQKIAGVYKVWQHFSNELCLDDNLDYSLFPHMKSNLANIPQFKDMTRRFNHSVYEKIINFVNELQKDEDVLVYINGDVPGWDVASLFYHYKNLFSAFEGKKMYAPVLCETQGVEAPDWKPYLKRRIVVIDMMTENCHLIDICKSIIDKAREKRPLITYISLLKCYTSDEAKKLISNKQHEIEEAERKRK